MSPKGARILMLLENNPYPQDVRVRSEATTLRDAGYDVSVISPRGPGEKRSESLDGVRVYRYPPPPAATGFLGYAFEYAYSTLAALLLSARIASSRGFDVVHVHNPPDTLVLIAALYKLFGKRYVYDQHDLAPEMYEARFGRGARPVVRKTLVVLEQLSCRLADHVIATNESYKKMQMERGRVPADRITVVRNGPDLDRFIPLAPDAELRTRAATILAYAGVMGAQDGIDHLLRAVHYLVRHLGRTDTLCILAGDGDARSDLERLAHELDIDEHVSFVGYVPQKELLRYLATADICVTPDPSNAYTDRSTMVKMMEYMAMAKPVVAFDLPEHRITAESAALYATPNDERAFAAAIAELIDDPPRREAMGAFGRRRVEEALAWQHSSARLLAAYRKLLAAASAPTAVVSSLLRQ